MKAQLLKAIPAMLAFLTLNAAAVTRYVDLNCTNATAPYTNWPTAATNIQDAVDAATAGDEIVVTNGVYQTGAQAVHGMSNRVAVTKPVVVRSVNGPEVTVIEGYQVPGTTNGAEAIRCVYLTNGAVLIGFTMTNGATQTSGDTFRNTSGGGVWCESASAVVSNCLVAGNSAYLLGYGGGAYSGKLYNCTLSGNSAGVGGGASRASLYNCTLSGNSAPTSSGAGGGAAQCTLYNCTVTGNSAAGGGGAIVCQLNNCTLTGNSAIGEGGGVYNCDLKNCTVTGNSATTGGGVSEARLWNWIVYYNTAPSGANWHCGGRLPCFMRYTCTTPLPFGSGNITTEPLFLNTNGWSDLRLQSNSPCVNAGTNDIVSWTTDLDGNARIVGGTVDMGAYECQSPALLDFYLWLESYGQPTQAGNEYVDFDGDHMNNWQEWRTDTIPTNAVSVLRMVTATNGPSGLEVSWQSVSTRNYWLERATNLSDTPPFQSVATNIAGASGMTTYPDTSATNGGPYFYRVGVQP